MTGIEELAAGGRNLRPTAEEDDLSLATTLMRGLAVLGCFQSGTETLGNAEIARRLDLNRATVSRLCKTLVALDYLRAAPAGGFRVTPNVLTLAYPLLAATHWRHAARPVMREIAEFANAATSLAVVSGANFVVIQAEGHPADFPHTPEIGITGPLMAASTGRALLSLLPEQGLKDKLAELRDLAPDGFAGFAGKTQDGIERCRREGFCAAYGDWRPAIHAASAPVGRTQDGLVVTLSCSLPAYRARREQLEADIGPRLAAAAEPLRLRGLFTP